MKQEWQPIETIPSNEQVLITWSKGHGYNGDMEIGGKYEGDYHVDAGDVGYFPDEEPTHWMPLPAPPTDIHPDLRK